MKKFFILLAAVLSSIILLVACGGDGGSGGSSGHINLVPDGWAQYTRYGDWAAKGTIVNQGADQARFVQVQVDLLDANGTVIGSDSAYVDTADVSIQPGQAATYHLWAYNIKPSLVKGVVRKIVWRDGNFDQREKKF